MGRADRVAGDHQHAPLDAVRRERFVRGVEEVGLVGAQLEVAERVTAVKLDDVLRERAHAG